MSTRKVAVVTGANKGIGYEIVKGLLEKFDGDVYLTSRDEGRGKEAVEKLKKLGLNPLFHQLDITDQNSIQQFRDYLKTKHGGLDLLVNNAAIVFEASEPLAVQAKETTRVNYFSVLNVCESLFPLLRQNARVVNISSSFGHLSGIKSEKLRAKFNDDSLTVSELNSLVEKFVKDVENGRHEEEGWIIELPVIPYVVAKVSLSALTKIHQRLFDAETPNRNISINSVHPGFVKTDMTKHQGNLTPEEGARAPLFVALEANIKGKYVWKDCRVIDWDSPTAPNVYE